MMLTADQIVQIANDGRTLGRGVLSHSSVGSRKGYAGYEHDGVISELCHVRHRAYHADLGRFLQRDPAGYADGPNLYEYVAGNPVAFDDPMGLEKETPLCAINTPGQPCPTGPAGTHMGVEGDNSGGTPTWVGGESTRDPIADDPSLPRQSRLNRCLLRAKRDHNETVDEIIETYTEGLKKAIEEAERQSDAAHEAVNRGKEFCLQQCRTNYTGLKQSACRLGCKWAARKANALVTDAYVLGAARIAAGWTAWKIGELAAAGYNLKIAEAACHKEFGPEQPANPSRPNDPWRGPKW